MIHDAVSKNLIPPVMELSLIDPSVTQDFDSVADLENTENTQQDRM